MILMNVSMGEYAQVVLTGIVVGIGIVLSMGLWCWFTTKVGE